MQQSKCGSDHQKRRSGTVKKLQSQNSNWSLIPSPRPKKSGFSWSMAPWQKSSGNFHLPPGNYARSATSECWRCWKLYWSASLSSLVVGRVEGKPAKQWRDILFEKKGDNDYTINIYIYDMYNILYIVHYIHLSICTEVSTCFCWSSSQLDYIHWTIFG